MATILKNVSLYTLNLYSVICQIYLNFLKKKIKRVFPIAFWTLGEV